MRHKLKENKRLLLALTEEVPFPPLHGRILEFNLLSAFPVPKAEFAQHASKNRVQSAVL